MRILHIGKYYRPYSGGIENFMAALMEESSSQGHSVAGIVHDHSKGKLPQNEIDSGVEIYRVRSYGQLLYAPMAPAFYSVTQRVIREFKPDILHLHMPNLSVFFLLLMGVARKLPWVVHWHSDVEFAREQRLGRFAYKIVYSIFESAVLNFSKQIIVTSPPYLDSSKPLAPFGHKCAVVPLALPGNQLPEEVAGKLANDKFEEPRLLKLLMVGRLSLYKGHRILLEALSRIPNVENYIELDIVGSGECGSLLLAQINHLGLEKCVKLRGYVPDWKVRKYFRDCDVFCLPSTHRSEAFGLVLLEAFREGKPCLVSQVEGSGMTWVVNSGSEGWHFKNGNVESLVGSLNLIIASPKSVSEFGENAHKRYNEVFKIDKICQEIQRLYELASISANGG